MTRSTAVYTCLPLLGVVLLVITGWAARRTHNAVDFMLGNRRLGPWLAGFGYVATTVNAWLLLGMSAAAFLWGRAALWVWGAAIFGFILNGWYVAPRLRAASAGTRGVTLAQMLCADAGDRLQPLVVRSTVLIVTLALLFEITALLGTATAALTTDFGFDPGTTITMSVATITLCVLIGGFWAVSVIDVVQVVLMLAVALFLPLPALVALNGWEHLWSGLAVFGPEATDWFGGRTGVVALAFAAGVMGAGLSMTGQPQAVARFMATRDDATVGRARIIALVTIAILLGAVILCGWSARVLYAGLEHPEGGMVAIANRILPPWASAMLELAIMTAVLAGIASQMLAIATALAGDLKNVVSSFSAEWTRAALVIVAILAMIAALNAPAGLLHHAEVSFTAMGAAFGPLLLVKLSGKRVRPGSILGAMWAGFTLTIVFHLLPDSPGDFLERVLPYIAALGIALTGGERRRNPDRADRAEETVHDRVPI